MASTIKKIKAGGVTFSLNKKGDEVKVVIGKEIRHVKQADLYGVAFAMTNDDDMRDNLMPVRKTEEEALPILDRMVKPKLSPTVPVGDVKSVL